jgi:hypothetical protein
MQFIKAFQNKYFITLAAFIVLMLFIDHNDIFLQMDRRRQLTICWPARPIMKNK